MFLSVRSSKLYPRMRWWVSDARTVRPSLRHHRHCTRTPSHESSRFPSKSWEVGENVMFPWTPWTILLQGNSTSSQILFSLYWRRSKTTERFLEQRFWLTIRISKDQTSKATTKYFLINLHLFFQSLIYKKSNFHHSRLCHLMSCFVLPAA